MGINKIDSAKETASKLPMVHTTYDFTFTSLEKNCITLTIDATTPDIKMPTMRRLSTSFTRMRTANININTAAAPTPDANKITHDLEQRLGKEGSKKLHMWFLPGTEPSEPNGKQDNTHYNVYGATTVANLLADALCEEIPLLKKYRK